MRAHAELDSNLHRTALDELDRVAKRLDLDPDLHERLRYPRRTLVVSIPIRRDDGRADVFLGYRVHHNTVLGPTKGGVRYAPDVSLGDVTALAMLMSWKSALMGLPYGGAKGGVRCDPHELSLREREHLTRRYTAEIMPLIGPDIDIPAPDLGTDEQTMAWMMDTYSMHAGHSVTGVVTGKPIGLGGSEGRADATGMGVAFSVQRAAANIGLELEGARVAVQGFGNVGEAAARILSGMGARIVAVTDIGGGVYDPDGLDVALLKRHLEETGSIADAPQTRPIDNRELLAMDVDVLVLAALEGQLTAANAHDVRARIVAEGANGPTTPEADAILNERGVLVIPDILCNAGGVIVSYFEWVQNLQSYHWTADEVADRLRRVMTTAFDEVWGVHRDRRIDMRLAALSIAVGRVALAQRLRGLYP
jgi:glutamate dehydrogenase (NAD(P)+)